MKKNLHFMMSVGEHSGDLHGSYLIKTLKGILPDATFSGMGGELMAQAGAKIAVNLIPHGTIGLSEAFQEGPTVIKALKTMKTLLHSERPDALILIDFQGFNMMLVDYANRLGIPTIYYISPQEWIWGTKRNLKKVARKLSLMLAVFPKEAKCYQEGGGNVRFIGHPFIDILPDLEKSAPPLPLANKEKINIGIFPGSRSQEIKNLFPTLLDAATILQKKLPSVHFYIPLSATFLLPTVTAMVAKSPIQNACSILRGPGQSIRVLKSSQMNLMISGSVTLEAALLGAPMVVGYRLSTFSYFVGKYLLRLNIPYISLPNIVLEAPVVPELIQQDFSPQKLADTALHLLTNPEEVATMKEKLSLIKIQLGESGVIVRAAHAIKDFLISS